MDSVIIYDLSIKMPKIGLEPTHLAVPEPKSGVSTNFTTWAIIKLNCVKQNYYSFFRCSLSMKDRLYHQKRTTKKNLERIIIL